MAVVGWMIICLFEQIKFLLPVSNAFNISFTSSSILFFICHVPIVS